MGKYLQVLAACLLALGALVGGAQAEPRVALIIGNGEYQQVGIPSLKNPPNDARAMDAALRAVGFQTALKVNASRRELYAAINEFALQIAGGAVGLFYYAGHGIQASGHNYLIPVDAQIESEQDLAVDAVDVGTLLEALDQARNPLNIVILDACRDNPLPKTRSAIRGLARVQAPQGTFIAYAAGPGQTAKDGPPGGNGIFTGELVKALQQPGLKIEDVFKRVTQAVLKDTGNQQAPWVEASIQVDFYFRLPPSSAPGPVAAAIPAAPPPAPVAATSDKAVELAFWDYIKTSTAAADYQAYLNKYPDGDFAELARNKLERLKDTQVAVVVPPPAPAAAAAPELEPIDRQMVAARSSIIRAQPSLAAKILAHLAAGEAVHVAGKVKGQDWYALERPGGPGYVTKSSLMEPDAYAAMKVQQQQQKTAAAEPVALHPPAAPSSPAPAPVAASSSDAVRKGIDAFRRRDDVEALRWFREAADSGDAAGQTDIGLLYRYGLGVGQDDGEAMRWLRLAADRGFVPAEAAVGELFQTGGKTVKRDYNVGMQWLRKAADQGDPTALAVVGWDYVEGRGVSRDYAEAMRWLKRAADAGSPVAMADIGYLYYEGKGIQRDFDEAARWYRRAADLGYPDAMRMMGELYDKGRGVPKDAAQKKAWLEKAGHDSRREIERNSQRFLALYDVSRSTSYRSAKR